jgi:hypothetical protein
MSKMSLRFVEESAVYVIIDPDLASLQHLAITLTNGAHFSSTGHIPTGCPSSSPF